MSHLAATFTRFEALAWAALRAVAGLAFSFHGLQKVFGVLAAHQTEPLTQIWWGGLIELVCGALIAVGWLARPAAFLASGTMAVAYVQFHWKGQLGAQLLPAINDGELAFIYCFFFLYACARGAGPGSLSAWRRLPFPLD